MSPSPKVRESWGVFFLAAGAMFAEGDFGAVGDGLTFDTKATSLQAKASGPAVPFLGRNVIGWMGQQDA